MRPSSHGRVLLPPGTDARGVSSHTPRALQPFLGPLPSKRVAKPRRTRDAVRAERVLKAAARAEELAASLPLPVVLRPSASRRWTLPGLLLSGAALVAAEAVYSWEVGNGLGVALCAILAAGFAACAVVCWRYMSVAATVRADGLSWRGPGVDLDAAWRDIERLGGAGTGGLAVRVWGRSLPIPPGAPSGVRFHKLAGFIEAKVEAAQGGPAWESRASGGEGAERIG